MPVNLTWDGQEAIPEGLKEHAVEKDGKWVFEAETASEVGNLKATLKKERDGRTKFEGELKRYERFKSLADAEDDERDQFFEAWEKRKEQPPKGQPPDDQTKQQLELKDKLHAKEVKKLGDQVATLTGEHDKAKSELREFKLWTPLREVAIRVGLNPEDWDLARLDLASQRRFDFDDDGRIVVMEDGGPSSVSPEKFFKDAYSEQRPKFYKATGAGGSGAPASGSGGRSGSKTMTRADFNRLNLENPQAAMDFIRKEKGRVAD